MTIYLHRSHVRVGLCFIAAALLFATLPSIVAAQGSDAVYRLKRSGGSTRLTGAIQQVTPTGVTLKTSRGTDSIPASEIEKIVPAGEPAEIDRARSRIESGRLDDAIAELQNVDAGGNPLIQTEVEFLRAYASAKLALGGGSVGSPGRRWLVPPKNLVPLGFSPPLWLFTTTPPSWISTKRF